MDSWVWTSTSQIIPQRSQDRARQVEFAFVCTSKQAPTSVCTPVRCLGCRNITIGCDRRLRQTNSHCRGTRPPAGGQAETRKVQ